MLTYCLLCVGSVVVPLLPLGLAYWLAGIAASLSYWLQPGTRRHVMENIRRVLGTEADEAAIRSVAKGVFYTQAKNYCDLLRLPRLSLDDITTLVEVHGEEHIAEALRRAKGVILVTAHLGNVDVVAQVAVARSFRATVPVERLQPDRLFNFVTRLRSGKGLNLVPVGIDAVRAIHRALNNNEIVAMAADRDVLHNGTRVRFFGEETTLPDAPAVLSLRTGARVLPVRSVRHPDGTYEMDIRPAVESEATGDIREDIRVYTQRITNAIESLIRGHPEQWVVFEPVWNVQGGEVKKKWTLSDPREAIGQRQEVNL